MNNKSTFDKILQESESKKMTFGEAMPPWIHVEGFEFHKSLEETGFKKSPGGVTKRWVWFCASARGKKDIMQKFRFAIDGYKLLWNKSGKNKEEFDNLIKQVQYGQDFEEGSFEEIGEKKSLTPKRNEGSAFDRYDFGEWTNN